VRGNCEPQNALTPCITPNLRSCVILCENNFATETMTADFDQGLFDMFRPNP